ncbi:response regulator transcription factor (plasmid) [Ligilactobacillus salivarius]|uniref:Response regulator transcription factor n=1 Tax=Ligilactobacillus salivarius TaxID=1624 RepID=A0ABD7YX69_9LACO|nr:response regulator transcription factor [Ligilactobacillus salivarius]WHS04913.1 response regulator transcription factor [Ligilactobacillus salivarius]WHS09002.1 response regulator transcription factor [Ligilactobacillus salivarius]WHS11223.1 response regulator transcription factor [Ligilactobacillus salivarius]WHS15158.1 response regulator transcription factor [Ligilactobacillus salivarius]WHS18582.1 response regulator transcription factor [Ligilactobacillus salivarius]
MKKVLIFEDEPTIIEAIKQELIKWQYQVEAIIKWEQVLEQVQAFKPDLILMDIFLPAFDGFYWTQKLREFTKIPIIFISSADLNQNAVRALMIGADDYLVKPFTLELLVAKIQALFRRLDQHKEEYNLNFANYQLNQLTNELSKGTIVVKLTPTESLILKLLAINKGEIVTKIKIIQALWQGNNFIDENVLNVNISRLRTKLEPLGLKEKLVTIRGKGYLLVL